MRNSERKEIAGKAVAWCIEHDIEPSPVGIVSALDALELLNDPAAQQGVHPTGSTCPRCVVDRATELHKAGCPLAIASG